MKRYSILFFIALLSQVVLEGSAQTGDRPVDGRLCIGNGYALACFTGPLELPEAPIYKVHDKISRLWLGYSSSPSIGVGLQPEITDIGSGETWIVGGVDSYRFEDGAIVMETKIPPGTVITETYGLWQKRVFVRRIRFIANAGNSSDYLIRTESHLYKEHSADPPYGDEEAMRLYNVYDEERERPVSHFFPAGELLTHDTVSKMVFWNYDDARYRKVVIKAMESSANTMVTQKTEHNSGSVVFENACEPAGGTLTVVLSFDQVMEEAELLMNECSELALSIETTQSKWQEWFESGCVVTTGNNDLDLAYKTQLMYAKIALDEETGGHLVGARYQIPAMWARDAGIVMSVLLDAGHYDEVKKILQFFPNHMNWNTRNNCMHANFHISGRVVESYCSAGQLPVEEITQSGEWTNQMRGPQLDGMAYYLYAAAKYYRYTDDIAFLNELWPFITKVGDALADNNQLYYEGGATSGYYGFDKMFQKYNSETGLIVDNCWESDIMAEYSLTNYLSVVGFDQAYKLSVEMGDEKPLWKQRSQEVEEAANRHLIKYDDEGVPYFLKNHPRDWLLDWNGNPTNGAEEPLTSFGYGWTLAATVPYFNYQNQTFRDACKKQVSPNGVVDGWGIWWPTTAHAAFEADLPETGWNYIEQYLAQLPVSMQSYESYKNVEGLDGTVKRATYNLFSFAYFPHAMLRGMAGLGYNEQDDTWFFRPQITTEIDSANSQIRIGETWFDVQSEGGGDQIELFTIDGETQHTDGVLDEKYLDGGRHAIVVKTYGDRGIPTGPESLDWTFDSNLEGWTVDPREVDDFRWVDGGYMNGTNRTVNPYIWSPVDLDLNITDKKFIRLIMKNMSSASVGRIYYRTTDSDIYKHVDMTLNPDDSAYTEYIFDMAKVADWTGVLWQIRFDVGLFYGAVSEEDLNNYKELGLIVGIVPEGGIPASDPLGGEAKFSIDRIQIGSAVSLSDREVDIDRSGLKIFPNPTNGSVSITNSSPITSVAFYTLPGSLVKTVQVGGKRSVDIDISSFQSGLYILKVSASERDYTTKIIKK
ncbi:MAG: T9SS type A sorting domain-containing protein [Bacteroidota bacterium]